MNISKRQKIRIESIRYRISLAEINKVLDDAVKNIVYKIMQNKIDYLRSCGIKV